MVTSCTAHNTATSLTCVRCGAPICPRCRVDTGVGFVCPDHAGGLPVPRPLRRRGRSAAVAGVAAVATLASVLVASRLGAKGDGLLDLPPEAYRAVPGLVANPGFEAGLREDGRPLGWGGGGKGYEFAADTSVAGEGQWSGRVRSEGAASARADFGTFTTCFPAGPLAGGAVRYSGALKADAVDGWAGIWMRVDGPLVDGQRKSLAFDNMGRRPVRGTNDWRRYEINLFVPKHADNVCLGFLLHGSGTLWGDDLKLELARPSPAPPAS